MNTKDKLIVLATVVVIVGGFVGLLVHGKMIQDEQNAQLVDHLHMRLLFQNGEPVMPAGIGIKEELWVNRTLDSFGIGGVAPMHTHDDDSVIHIEGNVHRDWTLGEFLDIWGKDVDGTFLIDGIQRSDYRSHVFVDGETIVVSVPLWEDFVGPVQEVPSP